MNDWKRSGLRYFVLGILILWVARAPWAASAADTPVPLSLDGPLVTGRIDALTDQKWFVFSQPENKTITIECLRGTATQLEVSLHSSPTGAWAPSAVASCAGNSRSVLIRTSSYPTPQARYLCVRQTDGKSSGTFSIHVTDGPILLSFMINDGAASTTDQSVILNIPRTGYYFPSEYIASEAPDFKGAAWSPYAQGVKYTLSAGYGKKTVYVKVRAKGVESVVYSDDILYDLPVLVLDSTSLQGITSSYINTYWCRFTISASDAYSIEAQANAYMAITLYGPDSSTQPLAMTNGNPAQIQKYLDPGEYSLKIIGNAWPTNVSVRLVRTAIVRTLTINNNAAETTSRWVTLNNACQGQPVQYRAGIIIGWSSEEGWLPYSSHPRFKLDAGEGPHTVSFQVRHANGTVSNIAEDSIVLKETLALPVDGDWRMGNINPAGESDMFSFTAAIEGNYTIETRCGTLEDTALKLYSVGSAATMLAQDDDSGENYAAKITAHLRPGNYLIRVYSPFQGKSGMYSIRLTRR